MILRVYYNLLSSLKVHNKHFTALVGKLVDFLCHYAAATHSADIPSKLFQYILIFLITDHDRDLSHVFPDIKKIHLLLEIQSRGIASSLDSAGLESLPRSHKEIISARLQTSPREHGSAAIVLETLQDIDKSSLRSPSILTYFMDDLLQLLNSPLLDVRILVHQLLLRLLHHFPRYYIRYIRFTLHFRESSNRVIKGYLASLRSTEHGIRRTALDVAPDFFHYCEGTCYWIQLIS